MKRLGFFLILLIFTVPSSWAEVYIDNDQQYVSDDGVIHVVGEIINESDYPINQIKVSAIFYSGNTVVHQTDTEALTSMIMPGMKGSFDLVNAENIHHVDYYLLEIDYKVTQPKSQVIEITSSELQYGLLDIISIKGTVANNGDLTANMVKVIATLYDRDGDVIDVSETRIEPDYLRAGDETFFLIPILDKTKTDKIVDYSLIAESEEYTAVPEFPFGSSILLVASLSAYIALTKNPVMVTKGLSHAVNPKWILSHFR